MATAVICIGGISHVQVLEWEVLNVPYASTMCNKNATPADLKNKNIDVQSIGHPI